MKVSTPGGAGLGRPVSERAKPKMMIGVNGAELASNSILT
jgi:hypothetical protein